MIAPSAAASADQPSHAPPSSTSASLTTDAADLVASYCRIRRASFLRLCWVLQMTNLVASMLALVSSRKKTDWSWVELFLWGCPAQTSAMI